MFIRQTSNMFYKLVNTRQFYDQEAGLSPAEEEAILRIQTEYEELNAYLQAVYGARRSGGKVDYLKKPQCLQDAEERVIATQASESKPPEPGSAARSSTKSRGRPKKSASSSNTSPS